MAVVNSDKNSQYGSSSTQPKTPQGLLQVANFTGLLQLVNKSQQACQFHKIVTSLLLVATCHFWTC